MFEKLRVSDQRASVIIEEIREGAEPQGRFYALLIAASMIACLGLIANSTAVIIGAMLVSPLMTPIFGMALGLLRGDSRLLWRSITAETVGILLAVGSAYFFGLILSSSEATPEMLSRTRPNLLDLLVAVFAGFAGAWALLDERVSPALPGVAIATAIVPPLSTVGLCLAMSSTDGAAGAMLLFTANLVTILLVGLITFALGGLAPNLKEEGWSGLARSFGPTLIGFALIAGILTQSLIAILNEGRIRGQIEEVLKAELDKKKDLELEQFLKAEKNGRIQVLATVRSPKVVSPKTVWDLQDKLRKKLNNDRTDLVVRTQCSLDVAPTGSSLRVTATNPDGTFLTQDPSDNAGKIQLATQVLIEAFEDEPGFDLVDVNYTLAPGGTNHLVLANFTLLRGLTSEELVQLEQSLQKRLEDPELALAVEYSRRNVIYRGRPMDLLWFNLRALDPEKQDKVLAWESSVRRSIQEMIARNPALANLKVVDVQFNCDEEETRVLANVVGPTSPTPEEIASLQNDLAKSNPLHPGKTIEFQVRHRNDYVVTSKGYVPYEQFVSPQLARQKEGLRKLFGALSKR